MYTRSAIWIAQGVAEKDIVLLHNSGKDLDYQGTSLGEAENPLHFGLDVEGIEDGVGAETDEELEEKGPG